jgi:hypothetical protein
MKLADYDHDGRATEFLLHVANMPCGKSSGFQPPSTLTDAVAIAIGAALAKVGIEWGTPASYLFSFPAAVFTAVVAAWPIARRLGMSLLMILSGPCPNCKERPPGWWASRTEPDRLLLVCSQCGTDVESCGCAVLP